MTQVCTSSSDNVANSVTYTGFIYKPYVQRPGVQGFMEQADSPASWLNLRGWLLTADNSNPSTQGVGQGNHDQPGLQRKVLLKKKPKTIIIMLLSYCIYQAYMWDIICTILFNLTNCLFFFFFFLTDEETISERLSNLPKTTQKQSDKPSVGSHCYWTVI